VKDFILQWFMPLLSGVSGTQISIWVGSLFPGSAVQKTYRRPILLWKCARARVCHLFSCAFNTRKNFYRHWHGNLQRDLFFRSLAPRKTATPPCATALSHAKRWFIWQRKNTLMRFIRRSRKANAGKLRELLSCYTFRLTINYSRSLLRKFDQKFN